MPGKLRDEWSGKWPGRQEAQVLAARGWRECGAPLAAVESGSGAFFLLQKILGFRVTVLCLCHLYWVVNWLSCT